MADKHYLTGFNSSARFDKKRASVDSAPKPDRKVKNNERQSKRQISQLFIDLNGSKNVTKLSLNRNFTHRIDSNHSNTNLCDMRSQIEQLRMQNQSLRQEIKSLKLNQSDLNFQIAGLKKQWRTSEQKCSKLNRQNEILENKIEQYAKKIKELFQSLIEEKKRKVEGEARTNPFKMVLSPSNSSISASLNLKKCEDQGYIDYFNNKTKARYIEQPFSMQQNSKIQYRMIKNPMTFSHQSSESSPSQRLRSGIGIGEIFGNKY